MLIFFILSVIFIWSKIFYCFSSSVKSSLFSIKNLNNISSLFLIDLIYVSSNDISYFFNIINICYYIDVLVLLALTPALVSDLVLVLVLY
jgi:hypothetical protein